ncbi:polysaccharide pyruvyl transferase family protein [Anaerospora hongkongensis]|uniref:polysaccharide pyruvyl transferase family protein n=1 Tax=Anaerospora hongkongensis TaxID=244830 RepID=UPI00289C3B19|nr:polysaccharide pyruvyl transferase family protein [Anaerospora hongkongensis]
MKKMQYWSDDNNFGDALNPYIQRAFGIKAKCSPAEYADFICIGSSMERLLANSLVSHYISDDPIEVFSTGFHFPVGEHKWYKNITFPERFARNVNIRALRGKLSLQRAEAALGTSLNNVVLGDGGLLTSLIFDSAKEKKYRLGIIAHMTEKKHPIFKAIQKNIKNSIILDIYSTPDRFIKKLTQCEAIISTALHPIIVSDSYGIPNMWINLSKDSNISMYKFSDYYSVFNQEARFFDLNTHDFTEKDLEALKKNYSIKMDDVLKIQESLIQAHPYSKTITKLTFPHILYLNSRRIMRTAYRLIPHIKTSKRLRKPHRIFEFLTPFLYDVIS